MKRLLRYLIPYKKECVLGPLFKLLEATFELFIPLVIASIIDRGIGTGETGYIWKMGAVLLALALIGLVSAITAQYFAAKAAVGFAASLKHALFGGSAEVFLGFTGCGHISLIRHSKLFRLKGHIAYV